MSISPSPSGPLFHCLSSHRLLLTFPQSSQTSSNPSLARQATAIFQTWSQLSLSPSEFQTRLAELQRQHFPSTQPLPGVQALLENLTQQTATPHRAHSRVHVGLATSSHSANFVLKTSHLGQLFNLFPASHRVLGDDPRIPPGHGKPAPDIYLLALACINASLLQSNGEGENEGEAGHGHKEALIEPEECLVFEDSVPGVEAGRRAGMRVVWVPHPGLREEFRGRESEVLAGLTGGGAHVDGPVAADGIHSSPRKDIGGALGTPDDGWADLLPSLEDFPYARYGIKIDQTAE